MLTRARSNRITRVIQIRNTGFVGGPIFVANLFTCKLSGVDKPVDGSWRDDQEFRRLLRGEGLF